MKTWVFGSGRPVLVSSERFLCGRSHQASSSVVREMDHPRLLRAPALSEQTTSFVPRPDSHGSVLISRSEHRRRTVSGGGAPLIYHIVGIGGSC